jgi:hypothetical protein
LFAALHDFDKLFFSQESALETATVSQPGSGVSVASRSRKLFQQFARVKMLDHFVSESVWCLAHISLSCL